MSTVLTDPTRALIIGVSGPVLTEPERRLFSQERPFGFILFRRNIETPDQVRQLTADLTQVTGGQTLPILVDQEGGRVSRFGPPHWPELPSVGQIVAASEVSRHESAGQNQGICPDLIQAVQHLAQTTAHILKDVGITVNCAPMLDIRMPESHAGVIGDRAFGDSAQQVSVLGQAYAQALMDHGILPIIKHIPGHGRAVEDSHLALPFVTTDRQTLRETDWVPFYDMRQCLIAMTAHIVYTAWDPKQPVTFSRVMINSVVRGDIDFQGVLLSDDLTMDALSGSAEERVHKSLSAGCDVAMYCNGSFSEREAALRAAPILSGLSLNRTKRMISSLAGMK